MAHHKKRFAMKIAERFFVALPYFYLTISALIILIFAFCGCSSQTTMDIEYLQEEAYQKGYKQGLADASAGASDESEYDLGYSEGYDEGYAEGYTAGSNAPLSASESGNSKSEESSSADDKIYDYVLNTNSKKFHKPDCSSVGDIKDKNKGYFTGTRSEAIAQGYEPCGRCNP